jgi:hypothetical protein
MQLTCLRERQFPDFSQHKSNQRVAALQFADFRSPAAPRAVINSATSAVSLTTWFFLIHFPRTGNIAGIRKPPELRHFSQMQRDPARHRCEHA